MARSVSFPPFDPPTRRQSGMAGPSRVMGEERHKRGREGEGQRHAVHLYTYLRDPAEIARRSFALIRAEADLGRFPRLLQPLALRLAHAAGDSAILDDLARSRRGDGRLPPARRSSLIRRWLRRVSAASGLWLATRSCARCTIRRQPGLPVRSARPARRPRSNCGALI